MSKKKVAAVVVENKEMAPGIFRMVIANEEVAKSASVGQFINIYPKESSTILPRPISICEIGETQIVIVYAVVGKGTLEFSNYQAEDTVYVSTALGNGFKPQKVARHVVVGGGIGVPPLLQLVKELEGEVIAVLGFRDTPFLIEDFKQAGAKVYIATESGKVGTKGNVIDCIKENGIVADYFYSCGPKVMLRALSTYCESVGVPVQVSLEERMGCGYGACVGCVCKTKAQNPNGYVHKKVCADGPVFLGSEVAWDE